MPQPDILGKYNYKISKYISAMQNLCMLMYSLVSTSVLTA